MLALNQRFRLRETAAGLPFWSAAAFFMSLFFLCAAYMFPVVFVKVFLGVCSVCALVFGTLIYITKDIRLFMDSIQENKKDLSAKLAGGDEA